MLRLNLIWDEKLPKGSVEDATSGKGTLSFNDKIIWDNVRNIWIDFLDYLLTSWDSIINDSALKKMPLTLIS